MGKTFRGRDREAMRRARRRIKRTGIGLEFSEQCRLEALRLEVQSQQEMVPASWH